MFYEASALLAVSQVLTGIVPETRELYNYHASTQNTTCATYRIRVTGLFALGARVRGNHVRSSRRSNRGELDHGCRTKWVSRRVIDLDRPGESGAVLRPPQVYSVDRQHWARRPQARLDGRRVF
jgi:hypothetical protein